MERGKKYRMVNGAWACRLLKSLGAANGGILVVQEAFVYTGSWPEAATLRPYT